MDEPNTESIQLAERLNMIFTDKEGIERKANAILQNK